MPSIDEEDYKRRYFYPKETREKYKENIKKYMEISLNIVKKRS